MPKIVSSRTRTLKAGDREILRCARDCHVLGASWFLPAPSYSIGSTRCVGSLFPLLAYRIRDDTLEKICSDVIRMTTARTHLRIALIESSLQQLPLALYLALRNVRGLGFELLLQSGQHH